ncbi:MAG TPA: response regulator [Chloroflexota bacterium]|nr:response regulator [Chloroflexota bacterium]
MSRRLSTILVVDDDPMHRMMVRVILEGQGHAIVEAANGEEALDMIGPSPVLDLVITDLDMPLLNGAGLIERLQSEPITAAIPIVVVSRDQAAALALKESGLVNAVISKPIGVTSLAETVRAVTERTDIREKDASDLAS